RVDVFVLGVGSAEDDQRLAVERVMHHPAGQLRVEGVGRTELCVQLSFLVVESVDLVVQIPGFVTQPGDHCVGQKTRAEYDSHRQRQKYSGQRNRMLAKRYHVATVLMDPVLK